MIPYLTREHYGDKNIGGFSEILSCVLNDQFSALSKLKLDISTGKVLIGYRTINVLSVAIRTVIENRALYQLYNEYDDKFSSK